MGRTEGFFEAWLLDAVRRSAAASSLPPEQKVRGYAPGLVASPLFEGFSEEELLAFMQGLRLRVCDPGEIIMSEGESGESVFILAAGAVKVHVRNATGRNVLLCELRDGAFFGEISTLSGRPRSATVVSTRRCELLELDKAALDSIAFSHPRVRQVLEEVYIERASSSDAERIRTTSDPQPGA
jgi:CRP-like cAMP-binding protein